MGCLHLHRHCSRLVAIAWIRTVMYFKDRNWISKTVNGISCSVACKLVFCSKFPDIPDNAGKVMRRTRKRRRKRRTQAIAKRYAFHANAKSKGFSQPVFTCSKPTKETLEKKWNMLKVNNKNTRTKSLMSFWCLH